MKKVIVVFVALSLLALVPAFAEEVKEEVMPGMAMDQSMGMPKMGKGKMCCPMMGKTQMVATDEGGVIVLAGNKLMKYDADLNLVKEAEVPMPSMNGKQCPMMGKMTDKGAQPVASESQEKTL